jgi:hypothetical protein
MNKAKNELRLPSIVNVMELTRKPRGRVLIHFTAAQWKQVSSRLPKPVKFKAGPGTLEAVRAPGSNGDMLVGGFCRSTRNQLCWLNPQPIGPLDAGSGLGALAWDCNCQDVPDATPPATACRFILLRSPRLAFGCDATNCPAGCVLRWQRDGSLFVLGCQCRR